jgi:two-component sensor histidine kinase
MSAAAPPLVTILRESWRQWWSPDWMLPCAGPGWLRLVWTFLFNCAIAIVLALAAWGFARRGNFLQSLQWNMVIAQCVGFTIHGLFSLSRVLLGPQRIRAFGSGPRMLFYAGVPITGVLIGYALGLSIMGVDVPRLVVERPNVPLAIILLSLVMSAILYRHYANKALLAEAQAEQARARERAAELEWQAVTARLQALQAQIEPHFLFNTLANVVSLIESEPARARGMLERLIELLRASLAASRAEEVTLRQEATLLAAYLEILKVRMGERLRYVIDIAPEVPQARLPPLTLQPLVENAIRHGLEPKIEGGLVSITAAGHEGQLVIEIADDGLGFAPRAGGGVGLANVRERLSSRYGDDARLTIEDARPGTRVRLTLPLQAMGESQ